MERTPQTGPLSSPPPTQGGWSHLCIGLGIATVWLGVLGAPLRIWSNSGTSFIPSGTVALIVALILCLGGIILARAKPAALVPGAMSGAVALAALFLSDWLTRPYSLFPGPSIRGEVVLLGAVCWWLLRRQAMRVINLYALIAPVVLAATFLEVAAGRTIFSDDHPVFLFRLISLKENFPLIPFYNPLWNGGIDARDFFATGALNVFIPFWPLIRFFDVTTIYNHIVIGVLFFLGPAATYLAVRLERLPSPAAAIAVILHLSMSLLWYRWGLKYGTMGFVTAASLAPLNVILAAHILSAERELSRRLIILAIFTFSLMVCWSLAGLVLLPAIIGGMVFIRRVWRKRGIPFLVIALLMINVPWMVLFWSVSNVGNFVQAEKKNVVVHTAEKETSASATPRPVEPRAFRHQAKGFDVKESLKVMRESAISMNPLILAFAVPGLFLLTRSTRTLLFFTGGWLVFLGSVCVPLKPQLELDRMLLVLGLLGTIPASVALVALFERAGGVPRGILPRAVGALAGGFLLTSPFLVSSILRNRTLEHYFFAEPIVAAMATAIERYGGAGRVLYSGFVLHELSDGHLAPLVYSSGKPLIASSYAHDKWRYEQVFPKYFIERKDEGIRRYLDLYNVTAVFAHERMWREYFKARPTEYVEVWREGRFTLFQRQQLSTSYFLEGAGEVVTQRSNAVVFRLTTPDAVMKFNYFPFVEVSGCSVSPAEVDGGIRFIKLSGCPLGTELTLKSVGPLTRLVHHE